MAQPDDFRELLTSYFGDLQKQVVTEHGDWTVKGFIDIYRRIYSISYDTKVLSKVLELLIFPVIERFANENDYQIVLARAQNQYPDITLISKGNSYFAVDIKTTYRKGKDRDGNEKVKGMTLGTYGGYFRDRDSPSIITFPYSMYARHYVLGVVYTRVDDVDERQTYQIDQLEEIPSVASDFEFFFHEKYRIATDRPGSGNTKNIGSTVYVDRLLNGTGVFADLGIEIFDDYWMHYRTREMASAEGFPRPPYTNLKEYKKHKSAGAAILNYSDDVLDSEAENDEE